METLRKLGYLVLAMVLMASDCNKEEECHDDITVRNSSSEEIIVPQIAFFNNECNVQGNTIPIGDIWVFNNPNCWETDLGGENAFDFFIISPSGYNNPMEYYDCDSIESNNDVLMHYELSLSDLRSMDWTIIYP